MIKTYGVKLSNDYMGYDTDEEVISSNSNLKLLQSGHPAFGYGGHEPLCYNYALHNYTIDDIDDAFDYLISKYKVIKISEAKKGDIVTYHYKGYKNICNTDNIAHFAKIENCSGTIKSTIITSKWGRYGVYASSLEDVPKNYGANIQIWRKK